MASVLTHEFAEQCKIYHLLQGVKNPDSSKFSTAKIVFDTVEDQKFMEFIDLMVGKIMPMVLSDLDTEKILEDDAKDALRVFQKAVKINNLVIEILNNYEIDDPVVSILMEKIPEMNEYLQQAVDKLNLYLDIYQADCDIKAGNTCSIDEIFSV